MGLEARQALSYVSTMSLANSGAYVASSWHALPAFHGEPFRILLGTRGSCCHLNLLLVYRTLLNEGLQVTALLSFCSPSKGKDPGTPLLSLELDHIWDAHAKAMSHPSKWFQPVPGVTKERASPPMGG